MKTLRRTLAVAGAAALVAVAGPAWAGGPYTVAAGGTASGSVAVTGVTTGLVPQVVLSTPSAVTTCDSSTIAGDINLGVNATGANIATINSSSWNNCQGFIDFQITHTGTWSFNATGAPTGGVTDGTVTGAHLRAVAINPSTGLPDPSLCSFDVTGSVDASFDQNYQQLQVTAPVSGSTSALAIANVTGCFGLVANGDPAAIEAVYATANVLGAMTIS